MAGLVLMLAVSAAAFVSIECMWRCLGHEPSVADDEALWSHYRANLGRNGNAVAVAGNSRILGGLNLDVLRRRMEGRDVFQFGVAGAGPVAFLQDLVESDVRPFLLICGIDDIDLSKANWSQMQSYVDYYHKNYTLNASVNRIAGLHVQRYFVSCQMYLNLRATIRSLLYHRELQQPNYMRINADRSVTYRFDRLPKADIERSVANAAQYLQRQVLRAGESGRIPVWSNNLEYVHALTRRLQERGTRIVFVRMPTSGLQRSAENDLFPRQLYWDVFARESPAEQIVHFEDYPELDAFECSDTSHLNADDAIVFTEKLCDILASHPPGAPVRK
jgi:hypothetical protein